MKLDHFNRIRKGHPSLDNRNNTTLSLTMQPLRDSAAIRLGAVQAPLSSGLSVLYTSFLTKLKGGFKKSNRSQQHASHQSMLHMHVTPTGTIFSLR